MNITMRGKNGGTVPENDMMQEWQTELIEAPGGIAQEGGSGVPGEY